MSAKVKRTNLPIGQEIRSCSSGSGKRGTVFGKFSYSAPLTVTQSYYFMSHGHMMRRIKVEEGRREICFQNFSS